MVVVVESPLVPRPELQRRHPHARSKRSRIAGPDYLVCWWSLRSLFCNAGHFVAREVAGSELRGYTNQETHHTDLKQIPLRQVHRQEQPGRNLKMHQSTTYQRDPAGIVGYFSNQLKTSEVT